jgi:hypothetical protein
MLSLPDRYVLDRYPFDVTDIHHLHQTDARRGAAWGEYNFIGRVRLSDGLGVLLRKPVRSIFCYHSQSQSVICSA